MISSDVLKLDRFPVDVRKLPDSWCVVAAGEVLADIQSGYAQGRHNRDGVGIPHLRPMNIDERGEIDMGELRYVPGSNSLRLRENDVLFNNTNSVKWVGKTALIERNGEMAFSNHMTRLRAEEGIKPDFVAKQLNYLRICGYYEIQCNRHVNQASISGKFIRDSLPFLVPPTAEQRRIVAKIESLQARSKRAREALEAVPPLLEKFRQSVLAAAFRGDLTKDWREQHKNDLEPASVLLERIRTERRKKWEEAQLAKYEAKGKKPPKNWKDKYNEPNGPDVADLPELPDGWCWTTLGQLAIYITSGSRGWAKYYAADGALFIRSQDINTDELTIEDVAYVRLPEHAEGSRTRVQRGDILITITGANVAKCACVQGPISEAYVSQHIALVRLVLPDTSKFLHSWLTGEFSGRKYLLDKAYGGGKPGLNLDNVSSIPVALSPIDEQGPLLDSVISATQYCLGILRNVETQESRLASLDQSILAKAFRGELVPQDPNDEPASVLLERIRAQRESEATTKPQRTRRKKSKAGT